MKRFMLFGGEDYYPNGGFDDFLADGDAVTELIPGPHETSRFEAEDGNWYATYGYRWGDHKIDWYQIVDSESRKIVVRGSEERRKVAPKRKFVRRQSASREYCRRDRDSAARRAKSRWYAEPAFTFSDPVIE